MRTPVDPSIPLADQGWRLNVTPGAIVRLVTHSILDCMDAFIRPRARHKLWILNRIRTCCRCKVRERLIDHYCLHLWHQLRIKSG